MPSQPLSHDIVTKQSWLLGEVFCCNLFHNQPRKRCARTISWSSRTSPCPLRAERAILPKYVLCRSSVRLAHAPLPTETATKLETLYCTIKARGKPSFHKSCYELSSVIRPAKLRSQIKEQKKGTNTNFFRGCPRDIP
eukprot:1946684-Amphidinium_carterae.1